MTLLLCVAAQKAAFQEALGPAIEEVIEVRKTVGNEVLGECTVDQAYGGMRSVSCMIYETSLLDPEEGIRFRGYSIPELQYGGGSPNPAPLPSAADGEEPLPEGLLWLLFTGEIPTEAQTTALSKELADRSTLPAHVSEMIKGFPKGMHPMTQFSIAIMACQTESKFQAAYRDGVHKKEYWNYWYEDCMDLMARLPEISAQIYRTTFHDGERAIHLRRWHPWSRRAACVAEAAPRGQATLAAATTRARTTAPTWPA